MRRFPLSVALFCSLVLILALSACGGSSHTASTAAASLKITPTVISLNRGDVFAATTTAFQSDGTTQAPLAEFTFASSNTNLASVSTAGVVCAGKWDAAFVVCTPATTTGSATITATLSKLPTATSTTTVFVHEKVDRVQLNPVGVACLSSGQTKVLTAVAQSTSSAVCSSLGTTAPCDLPSSTLGQFNFAAQDPDVVTIDNATTPGTATAGNPGLTKVFATVNNANVVNSTAQPMLVCPITQLAFKNGDTNDTAPFTLAKAATKSMTVTAIDSAGVTLTNPPVTYVSGNVYAITASIATTASTSTITAVNSGSTALTFAECAPPTCNKNLTPVFSQGIFGTVSGTYNAPTLYAASTKSLNLIPVDTSNNTAGTTITLPFLPNSFLMNKQGTKAMLGSDSNPLMILDVASGTVSVFNGISGAKVLSTSPDGNFALVSNSAGTFVINLSAQSSTVSTSAGVAIQGQFSPDSRFAYFTTGGSTLFALDLNAGTTLTYPQTTNIADVSVLANGPLIYLAQPGAINALPTCNLQSGGVVDSQAASTPTSMATLPNGAGIVAVDGTNLQYLHNTANTQACPPAATQTITPIAMSFATGSPKQVLSNYDGTKAIVSSTGKQVAIVNLAAATSTSVTLGASASVSGIGDTTADSATFYIGGTDNAIHKIDLAGGTDSAQIAVSLKDANSAVVSPDLIAVKNK
jgi:trimeric autotransporter adhesin